MTKNTLISNKLNYVNFSQKELAGLFEAACAGDQKSFDKLSVSVREIALSYFISKLKLGRIPDISDCEDMANNVYLSFAGQYMKIDNLENWLRRVLFLTFVNFYKKSVSRRTYEFDENSYSGEDQTSAGDSFDVEKINHAIDTLSPDKQQILKMRFWKGLKFSEIASELKKSEDAVKKMFYRTIEEIKVLIKV